MNRDNFTESNIKFKKVWGAYLEGGVYMLYGLFYFVFAMLDSQYKVYTILEYSYYWKGIIHTELIVLITSMNNPLNLLL